MPERFEYHDILEGACTAQQYVDQYPAAVPKVGETYDVAPNDWMGDKVTIVFTDERIAVGLGEPRFGAQQGKYNLYYSSGPFAGFRYQDSNRPFFRLQKQNPELEIP